MLEREGPELKNASNTTFYCLQAPAIETDCTEVSGSLQ